HACRNAKVVNMTAFTYRFAPSMRYMRHLAKSGALGELRHFRSQRFLDWPETSWGWRQYKKKAGAGDLFDMTIHRIDFAIDLMGPLKSLCGAVARFVPRNVTRKEPPALPARSTTGRASSASSTAARSASGKGRLSPRDTVSKASATSGRKSTAARL